MREKRSVGNALLESKQYITTLERAGAPGGGRLERVPHDTEVCVCVWHGRIPGQGNDSGKCVWIVWLDCGLLTGEKRDHSCENTKPLDLLPV